ncbi:hypothetical protein OPQ81_001264 [Rhizoctonia solani]|nr:hypothetical protein OPQ81_001264 [Rhizoctonia solani]
MIVIISDYILDDPEVPAVTAHRINPSQGHIKCPRIRERFALSHPYLSSHLPFFQGGKNRRRGKNENDADKRELVFREDGQEYAQVVKMLGNGRLEAQCFDGEKRLAHIRGKMRKKVWINQGDIILLSLREFQDDKADVIVKYTADEARNLKAYGELPDTTISNLARCNRISSGPEFLCISILPLFIVSLRMIMPLSCIASELSSDMDVTDRNKDLEAAARWRDRQ